MVTLTVFLAVFVFGLALQGYAYLIKYPRERSRWSSMRCFFNYCTSFVNVGGNLITWLSLAVLIIYALLITGCREKGEVRWETYSALRPAVAAAAYPPEVAEFNKTVAEHAAAQDRLESGIWYSDKYDWDDISLIILDQDKPE